MKYFLMMIAVVVLVMGCGESMEQKATKAKAADEAKAAAEAKGQSAIIERAIRFSLNKSKGKITTANLAKLTDLRLHFTQITDEALRRWPSLRA